MIDQTRNRYKGISERFKKHTRLQTRDRSVCSRVLCSLRGEQLTVCTVRMCVEPQRHNLSSVFHQFTACSWRVHVLAGGASGSCHRVAQSCATKEDSSLASEGPGTTTQTSGALPSWPRTLYENRLTCRHAMSYRSARSSAGVNVHR